MIFDGSKIFFLEIFNFQIHITWKLLIFDGKCINEIFVESKFIKLLLLHYDDILKFSSSSIHFFVTKNYWPNCETSPNCETQWKTFIMFVCLIINFVKIIENNLVRYKDLPDQIGKQRDQIVKHTDQFSQILFLSVKYLISEENFKILS